MNESPKLRKSKLYEQLKRDILSLQLPPGHDLDEASLSEQFGLSRTPLREVLLQLVGEGYAEQHKNRGCRVAEMTHASLRNFFLAAPMVYGAVLQLAAQNATPIQIARLKEAQMQFRAALKSGSAAERSLANNAFHMITGEMADNAYLQPSFQRLLIDHARIGVTFYRPQSTEMTENLSKASEQHDAIIDSIEAHDAAEAARLSTEHWNLSRGQIEMFVMPAGLEGQIALPAASEG